MRTTMNLALLAAALAASMMLTAGNAAYALGGPSGYGGRGYPTHPPLHGPGSSHNPIVVRRRGRY
jgi:hypothetical protein